MPSRKSEAPTLRLSKPHRQERWLYELAVEDWQYEFSFELRNYDGSVDIDAHNSLNLSGRLIGPPKVAGRSVTFILTGLPILNAASRRDVIVPDNIGLIELSRWDNTGVARIPLEGLAPIMIALSSGRARYLIITGSPLLRGKAEVYEVDLQGSPLEDG